MITNAVRCVPPQNKPVAEEIANCRGFLSARLETMARLQAVVALGRIAHDSVLGAIAARKSAYKFAHGAIHAPSARFRLFDSYHCSRYNTNTGRLTAEMFETVFRSVRETLGTA